MSVTKNACSPSRSKVADPACGVATGLDWRGHWTTAGGGGTVVFLLFVRLIHDRSGYNDILYFLFASIGGLALIRYSLYPPV